MVAHVVSVQRCAGMLESLTGTAPSVGFVHGTLRRAAAAMAPAARRIRSLITSAPAVSCDETPIKVGPKKPKSGRKNGEYLLGKATARASPLDTYKPYLHHLSADGLWLKS
jgi:hypothetical protein